MDDTTTTPKKRGRKPTGQAKTAQQRQADWRARQRQLIAELEARIADLEGKGSAPSGEASSIDSGRLAMLEDHVRELNAENDTLMRKVVSHERTAKAWKSRESDLCKRLDAATAENRRLIEELGKQAGDLGMAHEEIRQLKRDSRKKA